MTETPDLNQAHWKRTLADRVVEEIDATYVAKSISEGFRSHLGASLIGHDCMRYLWYHFRWFKFELFSGRMLRLFSRGHSEEIRVRNQLRSIGCRFLDKIDETGEQPRISLLNGHFGGSCDGIFMLPESWGYENEPFLLECKTKGTGSGFNDLSKLPLAAANPQHYRQMQVYMKHFGLRYGLYVAVNKNDDTIYSEIVEAYEDAANEMEAKAQFVILATKPPKRISEKRNYYKCNACSMQSVCHDGEKPKPNCRNCRNSLPVENSNWHCNHWECTIPDEALIKGCQEHVPL